MDTMVGEPATMTLETEIVYFESKREEYEQHYMGKFVVIRGMELVGAFDTFANAAAEAVARFGRGPKPHPAGRNAAPLGAHIMALSTGSISCRSSNAARSLHSSRGRIISGYRADGFYRCRL